MNKSRKLFIVAMVFLTMLLTPALAACSPADTVSQNISTAADNFEVTRRIVFYNGITNDYILVIEGLCSIGNYDDPGEVSITCKIGENKYVKHFLGLSDNVTYFAEQLDTTDADPSHYRVVFRPSTIVPDIEIK